MRPIIMSGTSVKAILDGRKTQTRRPVKPQPPAGYLLFEWVKDPTLSARFENSTPPLGMWTKRCPYGQPGDRLWVREAWGIAFEHGAIIDPCINYRADGRQTPIIEDVAIWNRYTHWYFRRATQHQKWRPSIFMPRWACRLFLEVTEVRVERLQDT